MSQFASQRGITRKEPGKYHQFPAVGIPYQYKSTSCKTGQVKIRTRSVRRPFCHLSNTAKTILFQISVNLARRTRRTLLAVTNCSQYLFYTTVYTKLSYVSVLLVLLKQSGPTLIITTFRCFLRIFFSLLQCCFFCMSFRRPFQTLPFNQIVSRLGASLIFELLRYVLPPLLV